MGADFSLGKDEPRTCVMTVDRKGERRVECGKPGVGAVRTLNGARAFTSTLYWHAEGAPASAPTYCVKHFRAVAIGLVDTFMRKD